MAPSFSDLIQQWAIAESIILNVGNDGPLICACKTVSDAMDVQIALAANVVAVLHGRPEPRNLTDILRHWGIVKKFLDYNGGRGNLLAASKLFRNAADRSFTIDLGEAVAKWIGGVPEEKVGTIHPCGWRR